MEIVEKIKTIKNLWPYIPATDEDVKEAEEALDMAFPEDFINYVKTFGCIDFGASEWTGLHIAGRLNTVNATLKEREAFDNFPDKFLVLENYHVEDRMALLNEAGEVYLFAPEKLEKICDNMSDYVDYCNKRN